MPFLREKSGRWSAEKIIAFLGACVPALWLAWRAWSGDLSAARPVNDAIHSTGNYAVWLVILSLSITPARRLFNASKLINMRRTLGVAAFCYAVLHLTLYVAQEKFDLAKIASEIVQRIYLTIGFVALIGLIALAATSTDGMIKRLGGARWNRLHKIAYAIAILGVIHFLMQTKLDITESVMAAGFLLWLLGYRLMHRYIGAVTYIWQIALAFIATSLTAIVETGWYAATTGVMWWRVFSANFDWDMAFRPAHWVLIAGLGITLTSFVWSFRSQRPKARKVASRAPSGAIQVQSGS
ncbi:MAG: methionine sulfoxide reductase heme-binding subunit [Hyphomicrobiales bacterium]|jgi:sulfoxide reductase heme-binding subunit YedZ|nr:methionine sulfoxide reductase heme-binding subunit [Hyphomicrobiales bacterium]